MERDHVDNIVFTGRWRLLVGCIIAERAQGPGNIPDSVGARQRRDPDMPAGILDSNENAKSRAREPGLGPGVRITCSPAADSRACALPVTATNLASVFTRPELVSCHTQFPTTMQRAPEGYRPA